jgi:ATP-binding cassette, subfamily B, bacterial
MVRKINSKITGAYNENITGVRVVKALGRQDANLREFGELTGEMYRAVPGCLAQRPVPADCPDHRRDGAGRNRLVRGLAGSDGGMTIGGIQAFVSYVTFMMWPIQDLARIFAEMQHAIASAERIFSLLDAVPEVADRPWRLRPRLHQRRHRI